VTSAPRHVFLVDGSGYIFRAFHGLPMMTRADGTPVNAVYGFTNMVMKLLSETEADHVAVIFDSARKTFRNDIYPDYKAHRPPVPEELVPQFALIRQAAVAMNVLGLELPGFEADDLIATYAREAVEQGAEVTVVSGDKDLMQLVGPQVSLFDPMKNRMIGPNEVREKFGVGPDKVVEVQALAGDSSDNVPGVPGIGVKTAAQLLEEYGDLESLLARAGEIKQPKRRESLIEHAELARISRRLVTLKDDVPLPVPLSDLAVRKPDPTTLRAFLEEQGFKSLIVRLGVTATAITATPTPVATDYHLVQSVADLEAWIAEATSFGVVAVDTETTALDVQRAKLVGVSLSTAPGRACYIPLRHGGGSEGAAAQGGLFDAPAPSAPQQIPLSEAVPRLKALLEDPAVLKVGHNIKYDAHIFASEGIKVAPLDDTLVQSYVLDGAGGNSLDALAETHFGHTTIKFSDVCGSGKGQITFDKVPLEAALAYAAEDADITLRLHRLLKERLVAERMVSVYETLDRPLIPILLRMEQEGIKVDAPRLKSLSEDFAQRMAVLETEIHGLAGEDFNVASPKQLGEILFERLGLPGGVKSRKTGAWQTGAEVLEELAPLHPLPRKMLDWRQLAKLKSTYTDALLSLVDAKGRVHTSFSQAVVSTGRLSSSEPNLQNIPVRTEEGRKIREAFIAEPGNLLISADYSQIELRLVAHVADIKALKQAFAEGKDIHAITASEVFGVPLEGMDPMVRRNAKAINFGIIYGISRFGLANQLGVSREEAGRYIDAYMARFPEIRAYMDKTKKQAAEQGFVTTLFGRKCPVPGIRDKNPNVKAFAERAAINAPIQGGAADIIKRAMLRLPDALADAGLNARMLLQVHDELVFEVPEAQAEAAKTLIKQVMEDAARLSVPLVVDIGAAKSWAAAH